MRPFILLVWCVRCYAGPKTHRTGTKTGEYNPTQPDFEKFGQGAPKHLDLERAFSHVLHMLGLPSSGSSISALMSS